MDLDYAKTLLRGCVRSELRDHAFGDAEVFWIDDNKNEIATGYFGGGMADVSVTLPDDAEEHFSFTGQDARDLRECGTLGEVDRNDETGPDDFIEGQIMPGLTKEGVFKELTGGE